MFLDLMRSMAGPQRTPSGNRRLGVLLAFVAGAANAGGFLAIGHYTSHMTGIISAMADALALWQVPLVLGGFAALGFFVGGAATAAICINWARRQRLYSEYALPLVIEAALLLAFGLLGGLIDAVRWWYTPLTVLLLCYTMGLQNALITKVSRAEIRTTHVTGIVTDLGIEFGKWVYWNRNRQAEYPLVRADRQRMRLLGALLAAFFGGGVAGALAFSHMGFSATLPLAALLLAVALLPLLDDARRLRRGGVS
ncbi:DUF1275 domain-containing protein [Verticiella sediminum]|uniref:DUF1275 domain-containing protein n=1 Tax=Verticiella sediminum TaxID=1247510 RepID=A0A556AZP5_9BURK|nr:DUF1275 domain-containing protein [Verticiella sediminum]